MALDPKSDIRSLLLTFSAVTDLVVDRIRPDQRDPGDVDQAAIVIEVTDGEQFNDLSGEGGLCRLEVLFRCVSPDAIEASALGEALRLNGTDPGTGLDGWNGVAGSGHLQANRISFSEDAVFDEDGEPTGEHEHAAVYSVWHQTLV